MKLSHCSDCLRRSESFYLRLKIFCFVTYPLGGRNFFRLTKGKDRCQKTCFPRTKSSGYICVCLTYILRSRVFFLSPILQNYRAPESLTWEILVFLFRVSALFIKNNPPDLGLGKFRFSSRLFLSVLSYLNVSNYRANGFFGVSFCFLFTELFGIYGERTETNSFNDSWHFSVNLMDFSVWFDANAAKKICSYENWLLKWFPFIFLCF